MPNTLAYIVVFAYPLIVLLLFRKLPLPRALVWSILGGYLFLPTRVEVDLPALPALDKATIPALSAALMVWIYRDRPTRARAGEGQAEEPPAHRRTSRPVHVRRQGGRIMLLLLMVVIIAPFATYYFNREPVVWGPTVLPPMRLYDSFSMVLSTFMAFIPFLLARRQLATPEAHREILKAVVWAGLACSLLILVEVRLSPQLNRWIYGFFPHSFAQHIRDGGFRPILFLEHGLRVGIFISMTVLAAFALYRLKEGQNPGRWFLAAIWLLITLFLSKTFGALAITLLLTPIVLLLRARVSMITAAFLACIVLLYPMTRGSGIVPLNSITSAAQAISPDRAGSLVYRLENEEALLDRASRKPVFGWGMWYRNGIYDDKGRKTSVTDGTWIITIGVRGWVGYLGFFGLLCLPVILLALRARTLALDGATAGMMIVLTANLIDLIPNSGLVPITWLIAGALAGRYELGAQVSSKDRPAKSDRRKRIERRSVAPSVPRRA